MAYQKSHIRGRKAIPVKVLERIEYRRHTIFLVETKKGVIGYKMQGGRVHKTLAAARRDIDRYLANTGW